MPGSHCVGFTRYCGARTASSSQSTVFVNGRLWAVEGDPNTHGLGNLVAFYGAKNIYINGKLVIVAVGDRATADLGGHIPPDTYPNQGSGDVAAYG